MELTIYIDAFWFVNFAMNLLLLWILRTLLHSASSYLRCCLAAGAGAAGACAAVLISGWNPFACFVFSAVLLAAGMLWIAFGVRRPAQLLALMGKFYLTAFLAGGFLSFLYYRMNLGYFLWELEQGKLLGGVDGSFLVISGIFFLLVLPIFVKIARSMKKRAILLYPVKVERKGRSVTGMGLLDTGNGLCSGLSKEPVLMGEMDWLRPLFDPAEASYIEGYLRQEEMEEKSIAPPLLLTPVPYHSVGEQNGILPGFRSDMVTVSEGRAEKKKEKVMIAIYEGNLSSKKEYQILLHNELT